MFFLNNKIHFFLTNANNSASLKRKMVKNQQFCLFINNKLVNEAANDSAQVSGLDRKKPPAFGTSQIAGFRGFRPLASSEKNKVVYEPTKGSSHIPLPAELRNSTKGFVNMKNDDNECFRWCHI